ncbi:MAG: amidohydrolase family protein [Thermoleophilia bacterium]|nr:amidohydrolase family protein [Thermoleophilia bacterium]
MRGLVIEGPVLRGGRITTGVVEIRDGRIASPGPPARRGRVRLPPGWVLAPGFVDLQVNGLGGDEAGDDPHALARIAAALPRHGVTAFCPTLVTRGAARYRAAARALAAVEWPARGARSLGVHLEGPFLAPARAGAHRRGSMRPPTPEAVAALLRMLRPAVVTLAPELEGGLAAVARLRRAGVLVSLGHTDADARVAGAAFAAGARMLTHAFNAMSGITGRDPGPVGAALAAGAFVGVIADGVHVAPQNLLLLARAAGGRLVAVSDAAAPAGAPPGAYRLGGRPVTCDGREVRDRAGRLAGSAATLATGPSVLVAAGAPRAAAVAAAAIAPRRALRLGDPLAAGTPADLVILDEALLPRATLVGGHVAWRDPSAPVQLP